MIGDTDQNTVVVRAAGVELPACKTDGISSGGSEGARDIQAGVGAEDNAAGIHQKEIGVAAADAQQAVNGGGGAAGDPAQDIAQVGIGQEVSNLAGVEAEFLEAVEQILTVAGETAAMNDEALPILGHQGGGAVSCRNDGLSMDGESGQGQQTE